MHVKKSGFVISLKEETMLKARQEDNLLDILQSSYPFYQLLDETDSCEDCRKKSGRIYPVSEAEIGINFPPFARILVWSWIKRLISKLYLLINLGIISKIKKFLKFFERGERWSVGNYGRAVNGKIFKRSGKYPAQNAFTIKYQFFLKLAPGAAPHTQ